MVDWLASYEAGSRVGYPRIGVPRRPYSTFFNSNSTSDPSYGRPQLHVCRLLFFGGTHSTLPSLVISSTNRPVPSNHVCWNFQLLGRVVRSKGAHGTVLVLARMRFLDVGALLDVKAPPGYMSSLISMLTCISFADRVLHLRHPGANCPVKLCGGMAIY